MIPAYLVAGLVVFRWQLFVIGLAMWLAHRRRISVPHLLTLTTAGVATEYVLTPDPPPPPRSPSAASRLDAPLSARTGRCCASGRCRGPSPGWPGSRSGSTCSTSRSATFAAWALQAGAGITGWVRIAVVVGLAIGLGWALTVLAERPLHRLLTRDDRAGGQRGNEAAAARKRSFSCGVPVETRTPSPANARTTTLLSSACDANGAASSPSGSQTKFAADTGTR